MDNFLVCISQKTYFPCLSQFRKVFQRQPGNSGLCTSSRHQDQLNCQKRTHFCKSTFLSVKMSVLHVPMQESRLGFCTMLPHLLWVKSNPNLVLFLPKSLPGNIWPKSENAFSIRSASRSLCASLIILNISIGASICRHTGKYFSNF